MFDRRRGENDRRKVKEPVSGEVEKRGKRIDRRFSLFERRQRNMDRRRLYDEFWMGVRDRRVRIMDRRKRGKE